MGGPTDPRVGGALGMTFDHANLSDGDVPTPERFAATVGKSWHETITRIEPPHLLAFTWDNGTAGEVTIELGAEGGRTRLALTHAGLRGPDDARNFGGGWHSHLAALQTRGWQGAACPISGRSTVSPRRRSPRRWGNNRVSRPAEARSPAAAIMLSSAPRRARG
jgi:hypothetical protein